MPAERAVLREGEGVIPAGTILLMPVRVIYPVETDPDAFATVEAIQGGGRMLVRLADLKTTKERHDDV